MMMMNDSLLLLSYLVYLAYDISHLPDHYIPWRYLEAMYLMPREQAEYSSLLFLPSPLPSTSTPLSQKHFLHSLRLYLRGLFPRPSRFSPTVS